MKWTRQLFTTALLENTFYRSKKLANNNYTRKETSATVGC